MPGTLSPPDILASADLPPVRSLDDWATPRLQSFPLSAIKDTVIGIDAAHYLDRLLNTPPSKEPLLSALGGFPFALRTHIENELEAMQSFSIQPLFVFNGMDFAARDKSSRDWTDSVATVSEAWNLYHQQQAVRAVEMFGNSGAVRAESLFRFLQKILHANHVDFLVAPYAAAAQLAYMEQNPKRFVDAIMGPSDLFLFDVDKVIVRFDFERSRFWWLSRHTCLEELGKISADTFVDACLLSGSTFLPTFPPLENQRKAFGIRDTTSMILTLGPSVTAVCTHYQDEPQVQQRDYLDRYRRARLAVKHHVILADDGQVQPMDLDHAPSDVHEFIGLRLPEEVYFYLSRAVIGPRVLNWITAGEIHEYPPLDNGETAEYQRLVREQLDSYRTLSFALLSQPLSRFYQRKDILMHCWFAKDTDKTLRHRDLIPAQHEVIPNWNVKEDLFPHLHPGAAGPPGSLSFAVGSLGDSDFVSHSITPKDSSKILVTKPEILSNALWRLLQLRGYSDSQHTLTSWGTALLAALSSLDAVDQLEEAVVIAFELLRLNVLDADHVFATYTGAAVRGSEADRTNSLLVSHVACLGKLRHKPIGFTGPLSRNLLAFHSFAWAVREGLRDLLEMTLANLLLNGDADRDRKDWSELGLDLPFIDDNDCGLGIAVKSYLDELAAYPDPTSAEAKDTAQAKGATEWFAHSIDMRGDLEIAFRLWDAVYKGVQAAGKEVKSGDRWAEVDEWLRARR
ncbi:MAG: hypothetical protein M1826_000778 [Phylliscum demangeonii]|nr:MAG: hypothetical protein M1826_000778 [Phylliscum demangeonii]